MSHHALADSRRTRSLRRICLSKCLFGVIAAAACVVAWAQAIPPAVGGTYVLRKQVIAGGGQGASGGSYALVGTVAQAEASPAPGRGGDYRLTGGFHGPKQRRPDDLFANGFEN